MIGRAGTLSREARRRSTAPLTQGYQRWRRGRTLSWAGGERPRRWRGAGDGPEATGGSGAANDGLIGRAKGSPPCEREIGRIGPACAAPLAGSSLTRSPRAARASARRREQGLVQGGDQLPQERLTDLVLVLRA